MCTWLGAIVTCNPAVDIKVSLNKRRYPWLPAKRNIVQCRKTMRLFLSHWRGFGDCVVVYRSHVSPLTRSRGDQTPGGRWEGQSSRCYIFTTTFGNLYTISLPVSRSCGLIAKITDKLDYRNFVSQRDGILRRDKITSKSIYVCQT